MAEQELTEQKLGFERKRKMFYKNKFMLLAFGRKITKKPHDKQSQEWTPYYSW